MIEFAEPNEWATSKEMTITVPKRHPSKKWNKWFSEEERLQLWQERCRLDLKETL